MRPRFIFWTISLTAALALSACAPSAPIAAPVSADTASADASVPVQAVATSRGPNLEATDPATVSLASGQLQLVEFFRFT